MKKLTFGTPERIVPTAFCDTLDPKETEISYDTDKIGFSSDRRGCVLTLPLAEDEHIYGFGIQLNNFDDKGKKITVRPNADPRGSTGDSHAPVPFFVSTAGYGVYVDTARYAEFYCGRRHPDGSWHEGETVFSTEGELYSQRESGALSMVISIPVAEGVDIYIFEGKNITDIVSQYNMFSGGGPQVPDWALGVYYRCYWDWKTDDVCAAADHFREKKIPVDVIGLEPGWQTHAYSCSYIWNEKRFPDHKGMTARLASQGYHLNLWQHAFIHPTSPIYDKMKPYAGDYSVFDGLVPDFTIDEAEDIFASYQRDNILGGAIDSIKIDECDGSDFTGGWSFPNCSHFPGGADGEQYHNLFGTLYARTMLRALNGTPTYCLVRNMGALGAPYPFVVYSDLYDLKEYLRGCLNSGFSGLLWTPELRKCPDKNDMLRRLSLNVFSPLCQIDAWNIDVMPWLPLGCEDEVRELLELRKKLLPLLRRGFDIYHETGRPPVRALVSDYTGDPETYGIDDEFIFCDELVVAPLTDDSGSRKVYLPAGEWTDYFTGEAVKPGHSVYEGNRIAVYRKRGE